MGCFACFEPKAQDKRPLNLNDEDLYSSHQFSSTSSRKTCSGSLEKENLKGDTLEPSPEGTQQHIAANIFTFRELAAATQNFRSESLIGEGGFGRVYKGWLQSTGQVVAVKQLDRRGLQGNREFLVEVLMLSLLHHPNLVNLIGYCADGDQRLLVYEFMPLGCLEDHLHYRPPDVECLDWNIRMRIAAGAARGLEYLHAKANPPVIYRDFKSSNILLDEGFHPKLSDFGLAKLGPSGDKTHVSTRVMGTYGYCAPEYASTGQLTLKSDVYSFGVVLLELITGRKAIDHSRGFAEHNLVSWAQPLFKDRKKFNGMADPFLCERYPVRALHQAIAVAAMCLQDDATARPVIGDVVIALNYLSSKDYDPKVHHAKKNSLSPSRDQKKREKKSNIGNDQGLEDCNQVERHTEACKTPEYGMLGQVHTGVSASPENVAKNRETGSGNRGHGRGNGVLEASSATKQDVDNWVKFSGEKDSPSQQAMKTPKILSERDREHAVAEAMVWVENWRHRKRGAICRMDAN